jgi:hypothetical protein
MSKSPSTTGTTSYVRLATTALMRSSRFGVTLSLSRLSTRDGGSCSPSKSTLFANGRSFRHSEASELHARLAAAPSKRVASRSSCLLRSSSGCRVLQQWPCARTTPLAHVVVPCRRTTGWRAHQEHPLRSTPLLPPCNAPAATVLLRALAQARYVVSTRLYPRQLSANQARRLKAGPHCLACRCATVGLPPAPACLPQTCACQVAGSGRISLGLSACIFTVGQPRTESASGCTFAATLLLPLPVGDVM